MAVNNQNRIGRVEKAGMAMLFFGFPLSVSVSQIGLFLTVFAWLYRTQPRINLLTDLPLALKAAAAIYLSLFLALLFALPGATDPWNTFSRGWKTELKDVFLLSGAVWAYHRSRDRRNRTLILRFLKGSAWTLLLTGFLSIFSKYRFSKILHHLQHGWEGSELARFQHHAGTLFTSADFALHLYMPIGFMNTHLTFAALLCFFLCAYLLRFLNVFLRQPSRLKNRAVFLLFLYLLLGFPVLLLNNGRSAMLGLILALLMGILFFTAWRWRKKILWLGVPLSAVILVTALLYFFSGKVHDRLENLVRSALGESKHTDYQRVFVWQIALDIWQAEPLAGAGPGSFVPRANEAVVRLSQEKPRLWYAYQVIQRGHAHNDLLHLLAIGGVLTATFYLLFFGQLLMTAFAPQIRGFSAACFRFSPLVLLFAGLLQCYFQDDETVLPFYLLIGLVLGSIGPVRKG